MKKSVKASGEDTHSNSNKDVKMTERDWQMLSAGAEVKRYGVGEVIIPRGPVNRHLFRIKKGSVRVEQSINGQTVILQRLKEKELEVFGEMALFAQTSNTEENVVADEPTEIVKYKIDFVIDMCRAEPLLSERLHKIVCRQLSERLRAFGQKKKTGEEKKEQADGISVGYKKGKSTPSLTTENLHPTTEPKKIAKMEKKASGRLNPTSSKRTKKRRKVDRGGV